MLVGERSPDDFVEPQVDRANAWREVEESRATDKSVVLMRQAPDLTPVFSAAAPLADGATLLVTSQGIVTDKGLRPRTFIQQRKLDSVRNTRADFDWLTKRVTLNDKAGERIVPLPSGIQDRLSVMYQFMFLELQNMKAYEVPVSNGSKVGNYQYDITRDKSVKVPLGTFKTIYLASPPEPGENRTEAWLAVEHANLPCKVDITDPDGGKLSQVLTRFELVMEP